MMSQYAAACQHLVLPRLMTHLEGPFRSSSLCKSDVTQCFALWRLYDFLPPPDPVKDEAAKARPEPASFGFVPGLHVLQAAAVRAPALSLCRGALPVP